jgi:hypothetical protein
MNANQIAMNLNFQSLACVEAFKLISNNTGISVESLIKQFPTNVELQDTVAKIVVGAAKELAL